MRSILAPVLAFLASSSGLSATATAQDAPPAPEPVAVEVVPMPMPTPVPDAAPAPGTATLGAMTTPVVEAAPVAGFAVLPPEVQVVRFHGADGMIATVLGPSPEPVPIGDGSGLLTVGMRLGTGYQMALDNLPDRPGARIFPYVEIVGHLHRPATVDPSKYPIRIPFTRDDIADVLDRGRMVTKVIYLEDPDQAVPVHLPKDEIPSADLEPVESPLKVAAALGRIVAIVRIGAKEPGPEDLTGGAVFAGTPMMPAAAPDGHCPFLVPNAGRCGLPCGPVVSCGPVTRAATPGPGLPRDEYLCDGGDAGTPAHVSADNSVRGLEPRDAVIRFDDDRRARVLPTNRVCVYAPRFAAVRHSLGASEALFVLIPKGAEQMERQVGIESRQDPRGLTRNQALEAARHRSRPSALLGRDGVARHTEFRILSGTDTITQIAGHVFTATPESKNTNLLPSQAKNRLKLGGIKTAEGVVVNGILQGPNQRVMAWKPQEVAGVETPPNRPGVAVLKQVDRSEAEPGDVVTYTITYRNMGNVPVTSVSVVDSLLPRLDYVASSAKGPRGSVFTAGENQAGAQELRWDIGTLAPGQQGSVSFQAKVR
jgi:uncharacterized repeat protein (TIGR01451 family)